MLLPITALYAGLLVIILIALGIGIGAARARTGISILHGDDMDVAVRMRRHGNFVENAPYALLLMAIIEANGAGSTLLHALGIALVVSRILHPLGLKHDNARDPLRGIGAFGTILVIAIAGGTAVWQFLS